MIYLEISLTDGDAIEDRFLLVNLATARRPEPEAEQ
jgi:hypothetical protein